MRPGAATMARSASFNIGRMSHRALTLPALKKEVAMNRFAIACLSLLAFGWVLVVRADDPAKPDDSAKPKDDKSSAAIKEESRENQQMLERRFKDFEQSLLRLAQRLEKSSKPEDRQRAETLKK